MFCCHDCCFGRHAHTQICKQTMKRTKHTGVFGFWFFLCRHFFFSHTAGVVNLFVTLRKVQTISSSYFLGGKAFLRTKDLARGGRQTKDCSQTLSFGFQFRLGKYFSEEGRLPFYFLKIGFLEYLRISGEIRIQCVTPVAGSICTTFPDPKLEK